MAFIVSHAHLLAGTLFAATTDSEAAFFAINTGDSSEPGVFDLLARMGEAMREHDIYVLAEWVPRELNFETDCLSKRKHPAQACARQLPLL